MKYLGFASGLLLMSCTYGVQTSSGEDYIARGKDAFAVSSYTEASSRNEIIRAARVEPTLKLPARFGLARIVNGRMTAIPSSEMDDWAGLAKRNANLGEFVSVSPLVAELTAQSVMRKGSTRSVLKTIQLGAARQHVDAVLIYELGATSRRGNTPFALADLTIIGAALLPTRSLKAEGRAQAMLIDVRNGYPYGTAQTDIDLSSLSVSFGASARQEELHRKAVGEVAAALIPEVEKMLVELTSRLARRH